MEATTRQLLIAATYDNATKTIAEFVTSMSTYVESLQVSLVETRSKVAEGEEKVKRKRERADHAIQLNLEFQCQLKLLRASSQAHAKSMSKAKGEYKLKLDATTSTSDTATGHLRDAMKACEKQQAEGVRQYKVSWLDARYVAVTLMTILS